MNEITISHRVEKPDGSPYLTLRADDRLAYIQMHSYDSLGSGPIEFNFDKRAIPMLVDALNKLKDAI
jgi:hypothetical protein